MRRGTMIVALVLAAAIATRASRVTALQTTPPRTAAALLKAARAAIGADPAIAAVRSLRFKGEQRSLNQLFGRDARAREQFIVAPAEIRVLLPASYLRLRENSVGGQIRIVQTGFSGREVISSGRNSPDQFGTQQRIFAQLMLLALLKIDTPMPLALRAGPATGHTLEFTGANDFHGFLDLDPKTLLPRQLRYKLPMRTMLGELTGEIEDVLVVVGDFRVVAGLRLPFHETVSEDGELMNETTWKTIEVNPALTAADFQK